MTTNECEFCSTSQVFASMKDWFGEELHVDVAYYKTSRMIKGIAYSQDKCKFTEGFYINYCPICGRNLKGEEE